MTPSSGHRPASAALKEADRPCPICSQARVEVLHTMRFELPVSSPLPPVCDIVACPGCGMVYADTPTPQEGYDRYYAGFSKYEDPAVATGGGASELDRQRLSELADRIEARIPRTARVLDVGCAGGGLLVALRERGFRNLSGTDAAVECVRQVAAAGFAGHALPLSRLAALREHGPFDLVVLSHVLEHVVDVRPLLADAGSLTAAGGLVYAETPDAAGYRDHAHVPFYFFDAEHINHFDAERLTTLAESVGLAAEASGPRVLRVACDKTYPACFVWMRRSPASPPARAVVRSLRDRVAEYVERSREEARFPALDELAAERTPLIVWGAGSLAQRLFGSGALSRCLIVAIVDRDRNKQGRSFGGFTVESPEEGLRRHPEAAILVAAAIHDGEIVSEIRRMRGADAAVVTLTPKRDASLPRGEAAATE